MIYERMTLEMKIKEKNHRSFIVSLLVVVITLLSFLTGQLVSNNVAQAKMTNLINNGSFENTVMSDSNDLWKGSQKPNAWELIDYRSYNVPQGSVVKNIVRDGKKSVKFKLKNAMGFLIQEVSIESHHTYEMQTWIKTKNIQKKRHTCKN